MNEQEEQNTLLPAFKEGDDEVRYVLRVLGTPKEIDSSERNEIVNKIVSQYLGSKYLLNIKQYNKEIERLININTLLQAFKEGNVEYLETNLLSMLNQLSQIKYSEKQEIFHDTLQACENQNSKLIRDLHGKVKELIKKNELKQKFVDAVFNCDVNMVKKLIEEGSIYYDEEHEFFEGYVTYKPLEVLIWSFNKLRCATDNKEDTISPILMALLEDVAKKE